MMTTAQVLDIEDFSAEIRSPAFWSSDPSLLSLKAMQQKHTREVLNLVEGNKARAAEILGISRSTLYSILAGNDDFSETG